MVTPSADTAAPPVAGMPAEPGIPERYYPAAGILFLLAFALYVATLAPGLMPGDTGDMVQAAAGLREAHPPGYPLYALLGKLFVALPIGSIPYRVNLMSAFFGGLSVALVFLCLVLLTRHVAASLAGALLFASNYLFWTYFVLAETFGLNNFFLALTAFLALLWRERHARAALADLHPPAPSPDAAGEGEHQVGMHAALPDPHPPAPSPDAAAGEGGHGVAVHTAPLPQRGRGAGGEGLPRAARILDLLAFVCGLSLGNHHTMVLTFPGLFLFAAAVDRSVLRPRRLLRLLGLGALGLLLAYAYLPLAALFYHDHHWEDTGTLQGLVRLFLRAKYGTFQLAPGEGRPATVSAQAASYFAALTSQYLLPGFLLGIAGLVVALFRDRRFTLYCGAGFLSGVAFILKANIDPTPTAYDAATLERFYQLPNFFFLLWVGIGLAAVARSLEGRMGSWGYGRMGVKEGERTSPPHSHTSTLPRFRLPLAAALLLLPACLFATNYSRASLRGKPLYDRFIGDIIDSLPKGSVLLGWTDTVGMGADYLSEIERRRPDVALVLIGLVGTEPYRSTLQRRYPHLYWPGAARGTSFALGRFLDENLRRHRVFVDTQPPIKLSFPLLRYGLVYEIRPRSTRPSVREVLHINEALWKRYDLSYVDTRLYPANSMCFSVVVFYYLYRRQALASDYLYFGRYGEALRHLQACLSMDGYGYVARMAPWHRQMARAYLGLQQPAKAVAHLEKARKAAPEEPDTYGLLAQAYRVQGDEKRASQADAEYKARKGKPEE